jgi:hypothetical protein
MITTCSNPSCKTEFRYLRAGRVVRVVHTVAGHDLIEHYWLCGDCCLTHTFKTDRQQHVSVIARNPLAQVGTLEPAMYSKGRAS